MGYNLCSDANNFCVILDCTFLYLFSSKVEAVVVLQNSSLIIELKKKIPSTLSVGNSKLYLWFGGGHSRCLYSSSTLFSNDEG